MRVFFVIAALLLLISCAPTETSQQVKDVASISLADQL